MLNAEKITIGPELKVYILFLKKKNIGIEENHVLLSSSVLHHTSTTQQKQAVKWTSTVLYLLFQKFPEVGWTLSNVGKKAVLD